MKRISTILTTFQYLWCSFQPPVYFIGGMGMLVVGICSAEALKEAIFWASVGAVTLCLATILGRYWWLKVRFVEHVRVDATGLEIRGLRPGARWEFVSWKYVTSVDASSIWSSMPFCTIHFDRGVRNRDVVFWPKVDLRRRPFKSLPILADMEQLIAEHRKRQGNI